MPGQNNQEELSHNQADGKFDSSAAGGDELNSDDTETSGEVYSNNLMGNKAENQVRENEEASLQDDTYAFDEDNTGSEEYHDASDVEDGVDDYIQ